MGTARHNQTTSDQPKGKAGTKRVFMEQKMLVSRENMVREDASTKLKNKIGTHRACMDVDSAKMRSSS